MIVQSGNNQLNPQQDKEQAKIKKRKTQDEEQVTESNVKRIKDDEPKIKRTKTKKQNKKAQKEIPKNEDHQF